MKICPVCGDPIKGRMDKVYCTPKCKNAAHYEDRLLKEDFFVFVDKQLKTNRKILKRYNQGGYTTLRKDVLLKEGFNPKFFTHFWKNAKGEVYLFCYEFGFLNKVINNKEKYVLIKWQKYMR